MYGQRPVGPVETISSTPDSRLTRSLQNSRGSPKEIEHFRRGEREVEQHPTLLIRLKAFGENSGSHHERLAHLKNFLVRGVTPTTSEFLVVIIAMKATKQLAVSMDAFLRMLTHVFLV